MPKILEGIKVIEGACADMVLVADPDKNFVVIMKDGKVYKNTPGN